MGPCRLSELIYQVLFGLGGHLGQHVGEVDHSLLVNVGTLVDGLGDACLEVPC